MRALPFLAAILFAAPIADAKSELELLQDRCHEQERQIRQLEEENSRLKLMSTASHTPVTTQSPAAKSEAKTESAAAPKAAEKPAADAPSYGVVRKGDTLSKIAKRHGTTPETLAKLNKIKNPTLIQIGQKLILPGKPAPAVAKAPVAEAPKTPAVAKAPAAEPAQTPAPAPAPVEKPASKVHGTHIVKSGETFFSIARHYGLSPDALQESNPGVKPINLRAGQTLNLGSKPAPAPTAPVVKKQTSSHPPVETAKQAAKESAPAAASTPAPADEPETLAANSPRVRLVSVETETDFTAFAAAHGTSTARINALNGRNLNSSTVLAKGSELYVPAQP